MKKPQENQKPCQLWKECFYNYRQQFHQHQQNNQLPHSSNHWTQKHERYHLWHRYSVTETNRKAVEMMTSTFPPGTHGSVAFLLTAPLNQGNPDMKHELCNII